MQMKKANKSSLEVSLTLKFKDNSVVQQKKSLKMKILSILEAFKSKKIKFKKIRSVASFQERSGGPVGVYSYLIITRT